MSPEIPPRDEPSIWRRMVEAEAAALSEAIAEVLAEHESPPATTRH